MSNVGALIKEKRQALQMTQVELAQALTGNMVLMTPQFISKIEMGLSPLPSSRMKKICKILSIAKSQLIVALQRDIEAEVNQIFKRGTDEIPTSACL